MIRHIVLFTATFVAGAAGTFLVRASLHDPHAASPDHGNPPARPPAMVSPPRATPGATTTTPPATPAPVTSSASTPHQHGHGDHDATAEAATATGTVNTICPICGMDVDPTLTPAVYQGQRVGFGCGVCPEIFAAEPERYGPSALRNVVAID